MAYVAIAYRVMADSSQRALAPASLAVSRACTAAASPSLWPVKSRPNAVVAGARLRVLAASRACTVAASPCRSLSEKLPLPCCLSTFEGETGPPLPYAAVAKIGFSEYRSCGPHQEAITM